MIEEIESKKVNNLLKVIRCFGIGDGCHILWFIGPRSFYCTPLLKRGCGHAGEGEHLPRKADQEQTCLQ